MESSVVEALTKQVLSGEYSEVLLSSTGREYIQQFVASTGDAESGSNSKRPEADDTGLVVAIAAFNAFLQTNVTGPVLGDIAKLETVFTQEAAATSTGQESIKKTSLRRRCLTSLDVDGVSAYQYIPGIELFCLARWIMTQISADDTSIALEQKQEGGEDGENSEEKTLLPNARWLRLRMNVWHYKLLTQPSLGPGSIFTKSSQWSDVPSLEEVIEGSLQVVEKDVLGSQDRWSQREKVLFLLEKANICIMLGQDAKARAAVKQATELNRFAYALSGALGKRTRFQENSTSQLVVLARSSAGDATQPAEAASQVMPEALPLNDDTLLEQLEFTKEKHSEDTQTTLDERLTNVSPDDQPQLSPLDQIALLTEATVRDAFSPADTLTSEEILPFAVRVISDKSTNWQIYTQALLVRSRIEVHRSRTVERGILQMQAVVDQVVVDTTTPAESKTHDTENPDVPSIAISGPDEQPVSKPTSFFPASKPSESAPPQVRLQYVHAISSPPRWHLESELAHAWASVGSLVSSLEIFKRLRLWAEVALCLAAKSSSGTEEDDDRRAGEEKARAVLRWRLFRRTDGSEDEDSDETEKDISALKAADYLGPERDPRPANAPRLLCILGDIEEKPEHYLRAWEVSGRRFARAQRSLGEHLLQQKDLVGARDAYKAAVAVNRLSPELWNRLGDISLRLGDFTDAAEAFGRAISSSNDAVGGEDARTWSNLGTALYSLYVERVEELKKEKGSEIDAPAANQDEGIDDLDTVLPPQEPSGSRRDPATLLSQSLAAYKRGASIANDNWRIWDNVLTLACRLRPPPVSDIVIALKHIIRIRASEDALDIGVLQLLLNETVLSKTTEGSDSGVYVPPRGSQVKAVCDLLEASVVPLITARSELWELVSRERVWRRDYAGAVDASERAWRAAVGVGGAGLAVSSDTSSWLEDKKLWQTVVERTEDLVSIMENYGPEVTDLGPRWRGKARSAIRSVMGKAKENWEDTDEWKRLEGLLDGLKVASSS
jgi:tetratricopeptide (TPR) repeat protein